MAKWKLVPLVATEEMGAAGARTLYCTHTLDDEDAYARDCFQHMVAASPHPEQDEELVEKLADVVCHTRHGRPLTSTTDWACGQCARTARAVLTFLNGGTDAAG